VTQPGTKRRFPSAGPLAPQSSPVSSDQEGAIAIPYRLLAEHAGDAFFVHDLQGRFLDANQIACESLGYSRVEILARSVGDVEIHYNRVEFQKRWKDMVVGKPSTVQGDHRRKDGTTFPVEVRVSLFAEGTRPLFLGSSGFGVG